MQIAKKNITGMIAVVLFTVVLFPFCNKSDEIESARSNKITLIWNKSYEGQTQKDVKRGLIWTLSWLGAELPSGSFEKAIETTDSTIITLNLDSVGFNLTARNALRVICDSIRNSEEYKTYNGIDIGKFVMLTLGSSWHYYEITGVPKTLKEFKAVYNVDASSYLFGVTTSSVAEGHRKIYFSRDTALFHCGFIAEEGDSSLDDGTFTATMYECFDIMPNGQLRFMVYDAEGNLASGSPATIGDAGKPTKCLWCHETHIQGLFIDNSPVAKMMTNEEFMTYRDSMQRSLDRYRAALKTDMDWKNQREHTLGELLYITYIEPTAMHMKHEWKVNEGELIKRLQHADHYRFEEFDYIGEVYRRSAIDNLDAILNLEVPESARETGREINYFK